MHPPIGNQVVELVQGVSSIAAEDNANDAKMRMILAGAGGELSDLEWKWFYDRGHAMRVPAFVLSPIPAHK